MPDTVTPAATWGISGPRFLALYGLAAVVAVLVALLWRRLFGGPAGRSRPGRTPGPSEVAYLRGGASLALYATLAALRACGAVSSRPGGALAAVDALPFDADDLQRAVYTAAARGRRQRDLARDSGVSAALRRLADQLIAEGWLHTDARRRVLRVGATAVLAVAALGVARIWAGAANHKPVGFLVAATIVVALVAWRFLHVPRVTRTASQLVSQLRTGNAHLAPQQNPSWSVYGPAGAALGVALFGVSALWAADPAFAAEAQIRRISSGSFDWSDSGSSGDSGSGSSCGGGGGCGGGGCGG